MDPGARLGRKVTERLTSLESIEAVGEPLPPALESRTAVSDTQPLDLSELLEPRMPSAMLRHERDALAEGTPREELAGGQRAVAALGLAGSPEAPPSLLRDRILASASRPGKFGRFADKVGRLFDLPTEAAVALTAKLEDPSAWMPFLVEGVSMIPVETGPACAGAIATLVRFEPGATFPAHDHRGSETMFVLDGGFREEGEGGHEVWRGDELYSEDGSGHGLVALDGVPCIAAVVITGHADFR